MVEELGALLGSETPLYQGVQEIRVHWYLEQITEASRALCMPWPHRVNVTGGQGCTSGR